jgi:hypothetical protein
MVFVRKLGIITLFFKLRLPYLKKYCLEAERVLFATKVPFQAPYPMEIIG